MAIRNALDAVVDATVEAATPMLHVRFGGRSFDIPQSELDIGPRSTDEQIRTAVATYLDIPAPKLGPYTIDRTANGELTLRPEAIFG